MRSIPAPLGFSTLAALFFRVSRSLGDPLLAHLVGVLRSIAGLSFPLLALASFVLIFIHMMTYG